MSDRKDSYQAMLEAVRGFHEKHRFKETGGEEMTYRIRVSEFRERD